MSTIYGPEPGWRVEDIQTDERTGACTLELVKPWSPLVSQAATEGIPLPGVGGTTQLALPPMPEPPSIEGWVAISGKWRLLEEGGYGFAYSYEGKRTPTVPDPSGAISGIAWSVRGSFRQRPITTHPNFSNLASTYEWNVATSSFPATFPVTQQAATRGLLVNSQGDVYSPFYGVTSYDDLSAVLTMSMISATIDPGLFAAINSIVGNPCPWLGQMPDNRNWRVLPPSIEPHGNLWRTEQPYMLSGPGGWNTDVYGQQALANLASTANGGTV